MLYRWRRSRAMNRPSPAGFSKTGAPVTPADRPASRASAAATRRQAAACDLGIVFAVPIEAHAFERRVTAKREMLAAGLAFREAAVAGRRVAWCIGGVGEERAARATRLLIDGHGPTMLVAAGFAGGLDRAFARGSLVEPTAVRGESPGSESLRLAAAVAGPTLVTVNRIVHSPAEKAALGAATGAALVDMETLAVARVARDMGLPCRAVRVISDAAGDRLPADVTRLVEPQSAFRRAGALLGTLGRRPRAALDVWQLWEHAVVDGRTLAQALEHLAASLA
jgi:adenosylhomocysteine nucleosidase